MKKTVYASVLAAGCSLLLAAGGIAAEQKSQTQQQREQEKQGYSQQQQGQKQQARQQEQQKNQYAQQLITPDKLNGMNIQNQQGEEIGSVDKVVLDSQNGQIAYVVVTSGGFWGVGGDKAVIPWKAVKLQQPQQARQGQQQDEPVLVVNVTKEQLMNAPQGEIQETLDRRQAEQIHQHYGVAPYWEGQQGQQQQQQQPQQMKQQQQQKEKKQERMQ